MTKKSDLQLAIVMSRFIQRIIILDRNEKACHGVTLSQHYMIDALYRKNILTMNELSKELNLAMSTSTRIIDILVRDGIVSRHPSESDRRKVNITLTEKGREIAEKLNACTQQFWANILNAIPDEKKKQISANMKMMLNALDAAQESCCDVKDT